jgi:hypothetical protein
MKPEHIVSRPAAKVGHGLMDMLRADQVDIGQADTGQYILDVGPHLLDLQIMPLIHVFPAKVTQKQQSNQNNCDCQENLSLDDMQKMHENCDESSRDSRDSIPVVFKKSFRQKLILQSS